MRFWAIDFLDPQWRRIWVNLDAVGWLGFQLGFPNSNLPNYNPPSFEICWLGFQFCYNLPNFPNSDKNCEWNQLTAASSAIQIVNQGSSHAMFHAVPQLAGLGCTEVLGKATSMNILDVKTSSLRFECAC